MGSWKSVLLGGGALLVLAGAGVVLGAASQAAGQGTPSMSLSPASRNVAPGSGEFQVEVKVEGVQNLGSYDIAMTFNAQVLEYVGAGDNGYLASTGRQQSCFSFERDPAIVNAQQIVRVGCVTNGLIDGGQGDPGPSGAGTLASIIFKPKAPGLSNLVFVGLDAPYPLGTTPPESGQTTLSYVESCSGGVCQDEYITFGAGTGAVQVTASDSSGSPTVLPPTPTPEPRDPAEREEYQKTVAAAVGTPRTLPTTTSGETATQPTAPSGTTSGSTTDGTTGAAPGTTSGAPLPLPESGQRPLTKEELAATGYPAGTTIGADGVPRGPNGVPLTGHGPQNTGPSSVWYWAGFALLLTGLIAMATGVVHRRLEDRIDM